MLPDFPGPALFTVFGLLPRVLERPFVAEKEQGLWRQADLVSNPASASLQSCSFQSPRLETVGPVPASLLLVPGDERFHTPGGLCKEEGLLLHLGGHICSCREDCVETGLQNQPLRFAEAY